MPILNNPEDLIRQILALTMGALKEVWHRLQGLSAEEIAVLAGLTVILLVSRTLRCVMLVILVIFIALVVAGIRLESEPRMLWWGTR